MSILRDFAYFVGMVLASPFWCWRLVRTGKWRTDWAARFGHTHARPEDRPTLLIHAVSVGEVNAVRQLVDRLERRRGDNLRIVVSATTDTGIARARELFEARHTVVRFPFDFTRSVRRFLDRVRPTVVALVELEVWPTFVELCDHRDVPVLVINGRLSERSHSRYRKIRFLIGSTFKRLRVAAVQDETYAERFIDLGVPGDRVMATGTMKWDTAVIRDDVPGSAELAAAMGIDRSQPLVVCGSTGDGEEQRIVHALRDGESQLLIAPRKPERFDEAAAAMDRPVRRTQHPDGRTPESLHHRYFLLDTLGELTKAYALADVVVVGRTFVPMGGSDMIEPIALGKATIVGPHVDNFRRTVELLRAGHGIVQVADDVDLCSAVRDVLSDTTKRRAYGEKGRAVIRREQGATDKHVELIESFLTG